MRKEPPQVGRCPALRLAALLERSGRCVLHGMVLIDGAPRAVSCGSAAGCLRRRNVKCEQWGIYRPVIFPPWLAPASNSRSACLSSASTTSTADLFSRQRLGICHRLILPSLARSSSLPKCAAQLASSSDHTQNTYFFATTLAIAAGCQRLAPRKTLTVNRLLLSCALMLRLDRNRFCIFDPDCPLDHYG